MKIPKAKIVAFDDSEHDCIEKPLVFVDSGNRGCLAAAMADEAFGPVNADDKPSEEAKG